MLNRCFGILLLLFTIIVITGSGEVNWPLNKSDRAFIAWLLFPFFPPTVLFYISSSEITKYSAMAFLCASGGMSTFLTYQYYISEKGNQSVLIFAVMPIWAILLGTIFFVIVALVKILKKRKESKSQSQRDSLRD